MTALIWDEVGERKFETGVDHGVLYIPTDGVYDDGVAWNGLTTVTESPSGAEATPLYADNMKYLNLISAEQFGGTIECYTYPDEFAQFDGQVHPVPGVSIGQQARKTFGLSYRTRIGNDVEGDDLGFKIHLIYGCTAAPAEKAYATVNDSPEAITFSYALSTVPVPVTDMRPTSLITIDSTTVSSGQMDDLLTILYGDDMTAPRLPLPSEIITLFDGTPLTEAVPEAPTFVELTNTITIPAVTGITYRIEGAAVGTGDTVITEDTLVTATVDDGYRFPTTPYDNTWLFEYTP